MLMHASVTVIEFGDYPESLDNGVRLKRSSSVAFARAGRDRPGTIYRSGIFDAPPPTPGGASCEARLTALAAQLLNGPELCGGLDQFGLGLGKLHLAGIVFHGLLGTFLRLESTGLIEVLGA